MYKATVDAISGLNVRAGGKWLTCIGNRNVKVGDTIWTDGNCVYGNYIDCQLPIVITKPDDDLPIPILFADSTGYSLFPNGKLTQASLDNTTNNSFFISDKIYGYLSDIVIGQGSTKIANFAVNLDFQQNFFQLRKFKSGDNFNVNVIKNGKLIADFDCSSYIQQLKSDTLNHARNHSGDTVSIPSHFWHIVFDENSLHLFTQVDDMPADAFQYLVVAPNLAPIYTDASEYYRIEPHTGRVYFDASIEGVKIRKGNSWIPTGLYPGSPREVVTYSTHKATSNANIVDSGVSWGVIEDEHNWAFIFSALVYAYAYGYYLSDDSALQKNSTVYARQSWLFTPNGVKELSYSLTERIYDSGTTTDSPVIQRTPRINEALPIQADFYFTINDTTLHLNNGNRHNVATMNISIFNTDDSLIWKGNIAACSYFSVCKNKKFWLALNDKGGLGFFDSDFNSLNSNYGRIFGNFYSGVYKLSNGQLEQILSGYPKNQKLRPIKHYKNWWNRIHSLD